LPGSVGRVGLTVLCTPCIDQLTGGVRRHHNVRIIVWYDELLELDGRSDDRLGRVL
jgi:hypothetical protein